MSIFDRNNTIRESQAMACIFLDDLICFPGAVTPLYISSKPAMAALDAAMAGGRNLFIAYQLKGSTSKNLTDLANTGTICRIVQVMKLPNGNSRVLVEGIERALVLDLASSQSALVRSLELANAVTVPIAQLMRVCNEQFKNYAAFNPKLSREILQNIESADAPNRLVDLIGAQLVAPYERRLELLIENNSEARLHTLAVVLEAEVQLLTLKTEISGRVKKQMELNQREYFLNEQIKELNRELGKTDDDPNGCQELQAQLEQLPLPPDYRSKTQSELKRLARLPAMTPEASILRSWLELVADLPWTKLESPPPSLSQAKTILDQDHYDLEEPKERILDYLAVHCLKPDIKAPILCFVGPPGTGKTSLGKSLAQALGRPFVRVSLGGVRDEAEIRGHRRTYVGALPGKIIQHIRKTASCNPVFLLDEIDKLASDQRGDPASALLEVLDPQQNNSFTDHYLELSYDLSQVLFIATANNLANIPYALRDRMEIIEIPGYSRFDKLKIGHSFILPRQLAAHGFPAQSIQITAEALGVIIDDYTTEAGVRSLDRSIANLLRKVARTHFGQLEGAAGSAQDQLESFNLTIDPEMVRNLLKKPRNRQDTISLVDAVGVANGLAWTELGGTVMPVEVSMNEGKGEITLTGSLGDVMKESARIAMTYLRSLSAETGWLAAQSPQHDIHIHVPEGATPKDGPSAGITLCTALASAFSGRAVRGGLAMTGELTLTGRVLAVGGIRDKVLAAHRQGIRTLILPEKNRLDAEELPSEVSRSLTIHYVARMDQVLELMLLPVQPS